jgi:hypothetical protein
MEQLACWRKLFPLLQLLHNYSTNSSQLARTRRLFRVRQQFFEDLWKPLGISWNQFRSVRASQNQSASVLGQLRISRNQFHELRHGATRGDTVDSVSTVFQRLLGTTQNQLESV